jgi:ABC-type sulfate/molybdate transport systems ATPase subunit
MITCTNVRFERAGCPVLLDCSLTVAAREHLVLTGPSGVGKTTLLRLIAGLELPTSGRIALADRVVTEAGRSLVAAQARDVGMVFQDLGLWPAMTATEHLTSVLCGRRLTQAQRQDRLNATIKACRLSGLERRRPGQMSGGEQQRLALARSLVASPRWLLLDEPFVGLDVVLRHEFSTLLATLREECSPTMITVTHQPWDALSLMPDRVAVMEDGRVVETFPLGEIATGRALSRTRSLWRQHLERASATLS